MRTKSVSLASKALFWAITLPLLSLSALAFLNNTTIAFGVFVGPLRAGAQSPMAFAGTLREKASEYLASHAFTLTVNGTTLEATPAELGITIDVEKTVRDAFRVGRSNNIWKSAAEQIRAALWGKHADIAVSLDTTVFETYYRAHLEKNERPAQEASLLYDENTKTFQMAGERIGMVIDTGALARELTRKSAHLEGGAIPLEMVRDNPFLTAQLIGPLKDQANKLLAASPFTLTWNLGKNNARVSGGTAAYSYTLDKTQLKDLLAVRRAGDGAKLNVDEDQLRALLVALIPAINTKPQNASLSVKNGKVAEFTLSQSGIELDVEKSLADVVSGILAGTRTLMLAVNITPPLIRTETIENLGLVALLGEGVSDFRGSPASRIANIKLGAKKLNGLLILPGKEFSFMNNIGDVDAEEGWQAALVIKGRGVTPEYGGGLCQVSTTMFRAAIYSGLPITERYPHSLRVAYYNPQGFDAAVYSPHPDLRFVNDTPSNILIQTKVQGTKLYFQFYGTPDGREVTLKGPVEYDKKPDGALKAILERDIYKDGVLETKDVFRSTYYSPQKATQQRNPLE